jgi:hypothetical protein
MVVFGRPDNVVLAADQDGVTAGLQVGRDSACDSSPWIPDGLPACEERESNSSRGWMEISFAPLVAVCTTEFVVSTHRRSENWKKTKKLRLIS